MTELEVTKKIVEYFEKNIFEQHISASSPKAVGCPAAERIAVKLSTKAVAKLS